MLGKGQIVINITGDASKVTLAFLRVYLANQKLTDRQIEVTVELVTHYAKYKADGVIEPYASTLLFSTEIRKKICENLKISGAHLNNTFNTLTKKNILAKDDSGYSINPNILPSERLVFNFKVNADKG